MKARMALATLLAIPALAMAQATPSGSGSSARPDDGTHLDRDKLSYAVGYQIGSRIAERKDQFDIDTLVKALRDAYANRHPQVPAADMRQQLDLFGQQLHDQAEAGFKRMAAANAERSKQFMAQNKGRAGVVTLPSGVQYKVLRKGKGPHPTLKSTVVANYRGSLIDGMEFDSSYAHGHPVTFPISRMLPGWRDVLPRMRVGAKWKVFIPPDQAYGARGQLPRIGPNEVLVFEIELLDVKGPSD